MRRSTRVRAIVKARDESEFERWRKLAERRGLVVCAREKCGRTRSPRGTNVLSKGSEGRSREGEFVDFP